jgi:hypothetical protein
MATKLNCPWIAFAAIQVHALDEHINLDLEAGVADLDHPPTSSTIEPAGIGCLKSIRSVDTVTSGRRQKRVAAMNDTSSIQASAVPPNRVLWWLVVGEHRLGHAGYRQFGAALDFLVSGGHGILFGFKTRSKPGSSDFQATKKQPEGCFFCIGSWT